MRRIACARAKLVASGEGAVGQQHRAVGAEAKRLA
jgi:hypothetical protein